MYEVKPEAGTGGNRTLHGNLLLPCNNLLINIPNETSQKRERRVRKDKRSTASQIPVPQAEDLADGTCSNDEYTIIPRNPHTPQGTSSSSLENRFTNFTAVPATPVPTSENPPKIEHFVIQFIFPRGPFS